MVVRINVFFTKPNIGYGKRDPRLVFKVPSCRPVLLFPDLMVLTVVSYPGKYTCMVQFLDKG